MFVENDKNKFCLQQRDTHDNDVFLMFLWEIQSNNSSGFFYRLFFASILCLKVSEVATGFKVTRKDISSKGKFFTCLACPLLGHIIPSRLRQHELHDIAFVDGILLFGRQEIGIKSHFAITTRYLPFQKHASIHEKPSSTTLTITTCFWCVPCFGPKE